MSDILEKMHECMRYTYTQRGYIVVAYLREGTDFKLGSIIEKFDAKDEGTGYLLGASLPQPVRLMALTDLADFVAQHEIAKKFFPVSELDLDNANDFVFYRAYTD
jgi:hypothetical protein